MRFLSSICGAFFASAAMLQGALVTQLKGPVGAIAGGAAFEVELWVLNPDASAATFTPPAVIALAVPGAAEAAPVELRRVAETAPTASIPPGGFLRVPYSGTGPKGQAGGLVVLEAFGGAEPLRLVLATIPDSTALAQASAVSPSGEIASVNHASGPQGSTEKPAAPSGSRAIRDLGLSFNEPMYFSLGFHERTNARFQLSVKYRPFGPADMRVPGDNVFRDLYFAYTQTSLWDLESDSKPFFDTGYKPSLYYYRYRALTLPGGGALGWAGGFEHESNGQGGAASRSLNIAFLRPEFTWGQRDEGWFLNFSPKLYTYLEKSENDDIAEYRGYGDYRLTIGHARGLQLSTTARLGTSGRGSVLADLTYPFSRINDLIPLGWVNGYFHVQYFEGYGETLRTYDERDPWQIRVGYMLVR